MLFTKSAFSKKIPKKLDFGSILGGQNDEKSIKNRVRKHAFLEHRILSVFFRFWLHLGVKKALKNYYFSKKWRFEGSL